MFRKPLLISNVAYLQYKYYSYIFVNTKYGRYKKVIVKNLVIFLRFVMSPLFGIIIIIIILKARC